MCVKQFGLAVKILPTLILIVLCASRAAVLAQFVSPTSLVSINIAGTASGNDASDGAVISADGRYVLFASAATDMVGSTNGFLNLFVRDLQAGTTIPVEVNRNGANGANGPSGSAYLSTTGRYVAFQSAATDLVTMPDNNGKTDVFVRDLQAGTTTLASINRFGTASGNGPSYWPKISADGRFVAVR